MSMKQYTDEELSERAAKWVSEWNPWQDELESRATIKFNVGIDIFASLSSAEHVATIDNRCGLVETAAYINPYIII